MQKEHNQNDEDHYHVDDNSGDEPAVCTPVKEIVRIILSKNYYRVYHYQYIGQYL